MDPLITNRIDPVEPRGLEKRGEERDPMPRRKRPAVPEKTDEEELDQEPAPDTPKHAVDDLA
ncbi:MAG: hypothetical protein ABSA80_02405 [Terriglobales bacterium]